MYALRVSRALLLCWAGVVVGCSTMPPEEELAVKSRTAPLVEGWQGAGSMADTRKYHAGVVLPSGKVLVVGGGKGSTSLASATVYDPGTGSWTVVASMAEGRQSHTATVLPSGKVLVAGGENASGRLASATVYDPATNTWASAGSFASGVARSSPTATLLASGKVLVAGGGNSSGAQNTVDVYDPGTGTWSPGPGMGSTRRNHTATRLSSGKVLVVGGLQGSSVATAELYDPATNTWTATGSLTTARHDHTATLLPSGKVLVVGGRSSPGGVVGTAEEYDPGTGTWSPAGSLTTARELHTATLLGTGKVLVAAGLNGTSLASAEVYDPATRLWSAAASLATARHVHVAVALESLGKVLVVGGLSISSSGTAGLATAEAYVNEACVDSTWYRDADGDGYGNAAVSTRACAQPTGYVSSSSDCNDSSASVKPGAPEVCNGVDDNCNGSIDEGLSLTTWYRDADGDGYGNAAVSTRACALPTGYVSNSSDCNDSSASVKPGATEVCNGVDDNCNGSIDDGLSLTTWYRDADGDGRGTPSVSTYACSAPAGYVSFSDDCNDFDATLPRYFVPDGDGDGYGERGAVAGPLPYGCTPPAGYAYSHDDCNDGNSNVHPGATEYCNNVDDNCNGSVDDYGSCVYINCSAYFSTPTVPSGGTATFGYTTWDPVPPGSRAYLYGTRDGVVDTNGEWNRDETTFSFLVLNSPGLQGYYQRYVVIRGPDNTTLCTTNTVSQTFLAP